MVINKKAPSSLLGAFGVEREGFEPPEPRSSTVFKTAAIDHSAISLEGRSGGKYNVGLTHGPRVLPNFYVILAQWRCDWHANDVAKC